MKGLLLFCIIVFSSVVSVSAQNDTVCAGATGISYWVSGKTGSTFSWTINGGTQSGGSNTDSIQVDFSASAGIDTIIVVETDSNGCSGDPVALAVVRITPPTASIAGATSLCYEDSTSVTVTVTGSYSPWELTYDDGSGNTVVTVNSSPYTINTSSLTATTTYTLVNIEDRLGCATTPSGGTASAVVTVYPKVVTGTIQHN